MPCEVTGAAQQGKAHVIYSEAAAVGKKPNFQAYDVRGVRTEGAKLSDCKL